MAVPCVRAYPIQSPQIRRTQGLRFRVLLAGNQRELTAGTADAGLGHADRTRIMSEEDRKRGVYPTILIDGFLGGRWRIARGDDRATLTVETFRRVDGATRAAIEAEGDAMLGFQLPTIPSRDVRVTRLAER
jgi:hypothetical protein